MIGPLLLKFRQKMRQLKNERAKKRHGKKIYLVYTMGKVGTTTVSSFFSKHHPELTCFHIHYLSDYWVKEKIPSLPEHYHYQVKSAEKVLASINAAPDHRVKIFTMVRDPMEREISVVFENWKGLFPINSIHELSQEALFDYMNKNTYENALHWFDSEFGAWLNFDIYAEPFNKEKGYSIYSTPKADILCMKTEKMNECIKEAMFEFTGMRMKKIEAANQSENKDGKELYKELKGKFKASDEKLDYVYNSKFVRHFYTEKEIGLFIQKWSRGEKTIGDS